MNRLASGLGQISKPRFFSSNPKPETAAHEQKGVDGQTEPKVESSPPHKQSPAPEVKKATTNTRFFGGDREQHFDRNQTKPSRQYKKSDNVNYKAKDKDDKSVTAQWTGNLKNSEAKEKDNQEAEAFSLKEPKYSKGSFFSSERKPFEKKPFAGESQAGGNTEFTEAQKQSKTEAPKRFKEEAKFSGWNQANPESSAAYQTAVAMMREDPWRLRDEHHRIIKTKQESIKRARKQAEEKAKNNEKAARMAAEPTERENYAMQEYAAFMKQVAPIQESISTAQSKGKREGDRKPAKNENEETEKSKIQRFDNEVEQAFDLQEIDRELNDSSFNFGQVDKKIKELNHAQLPQLKQLQQLFSQRIADGSLDPQQQKIAEKLRNNILLAQIIGHQQIIDFDGLDLELLWENRGNDTNRAKNALNKLFEQIIDYSESEDTLRALTIVSKSPDVFSPKKCGFWFIGGLDLNKLLTSVFKNMPDYTEQSAENAANIQKLLHVIRNNILSNRNLFNISNLVSPVVFLQLVLGVPEAADTINPKIDVSKDVISALSQFYANLRGEDKKIQFNNTLYFITQPRAHRVYYKSIANKSDLRSVMASQTIAEIEGILGDFENTIEYTLKYKLDKSSLSKVSDINSLIYTYFQSIDRKQSLADFIPAVEDASIKNDNLLASQIIYCFFKQLMKTGLTKESLMSLTKEFNSQWMLMWPYQTTKINILRESLQGNSGPAKALLGKVIMEEAITKVAIFRVISLAALAYGNAFTKYHAKLLRSAVHQMQPTELLEMLRDDQTLIDNVKTIGYLVGKEGLNWAIDFDEQQQLELRIKEEMRRTAKNNEPFDVKEFMYKQKLSQEYSNLQYEVFEEFFDQQPLTWGQISAVKTMKKSFEAQDAVRKDVTNVLMATQRRFEEEYQTGVHKDGLSAEIQRDFFQNIYKAVKPLTDLATKKEIANQSRKTSELKHRMANKVYKKMKEYIHSRVGRSQISAEVEPDINEFVLKPETRRNFLSSHKYLDAEKREIYELVLKATPKVETAVFEDVGLLLSEFDLNEFVPVFRAFYKMTNVAPKNLRLMSFVGQKLKSLPSNKDDAEINAFARLVDNNEESNDDLKQTAYHLGRMR